MNRVLVDANVILDVFTKDPIWLNWSKAILGQYHATHTLLINPFWISATLSHKTQDPVIHSSAHPRDLPAPPATPARSRSTAR